MRGIRTPPDWGITPVHSTHKCLGFIDYFAFWSSINAGLFVVLAGSQLVPGLRIDEAFLAMVLGSAIGTIPLALVGFMGSKYGVSTMVVTRPALGARGSYVPSILNAIQLIGWTVFEIILMANAVNVVALQTIGRSGLRFWIMFFAILCTLMAILGPLVVVRKWVAKLAIWTAYGTGLWLLYNILANGGMAKVLSVQATGSLPFAVAVDLVARNSYFVDAHRV